MRVSLGLKRLRHLLEKLKKHTAHCIDKEAAVVVTPETSLNGETEINPTFSTELDLAVKEEERVFHLFPDLPTEIRFKIWQEIAESTTQVVNIVPYTTGCGRSRRKFKYYGCYRSRTPIPPFLQVSRETRLEGLTHYELLLRGKEFQPIIPFNCERDILFLSLDLTDARYLIQSLRNMLGPLVWSKVQNLTFQVNAWQSYPRNLELIEEMPSLKQLHFSSWGPHEYRTNLQQVLKSQMLKWSVRDCASMLGRDAFGQIDYLGFDHMHPYVQLNFHFHKLKLEFEYARRHKEDAFAIKLLNWSPQLPILSSLATIITDNPSNDTSDLITISPPPIEVEDTSRFSLVPTIPSEILVNDEFAIVPEVLPKRNSASIRSSIIMGLGIVADEFITSTQTLETAVDEIVTADADTPTGEVVIEDG